MRTSAPYISTLLLVNVSTYQTRVKALSNLVLRFNSCLQRIVLHEGWVINSAYVSKEHHAMDPIHRCTCSPCITEFSPFIDSLWSHLAWPCLPVLILLIYETGLAASSKNILCRVTIQVLTYVRSAPRMEYKSSNVSILFYVPATCVGPSCESKPLIMGYAGNNLLYGLF